MYNNHKMISRIPMNHNKAIPYFLISIIGIVFYLVMDIISQLFPRHYGPISQA